MSHGDTQGSPSERQQQVNLAVWSLLNWLVYLAAPVLYVDIVQTSLCDRQGASKTIANLPSSAYVLAALAGPVVVWAFPRPSIVIPMLVALHGLLAAAAALMTLVLLICTSPGIIVTATVVFGAVCGLALVVIGIYRWEALSRAVAEDKRGRLFSLSFGVGPVFAVLGSAGVHHILGTPDLEYPRDYAVLFAAIIPLMLLGAAAARWMRLSPGVPALERESLQRYIFAGTREYLSRQHFRNISLSYVALFSAFYAINNASLYLRETAGDLSEQAAGLAVSFRYAGKVACGLALGWCYGRWGPRSAAALTAGLVVAGSAWALLARGSFYLGAFACLGGGELAGAYYFIYVVALSPSHLVKRHTALLNVASAPVAAAPLLLGLIADHFGNRASLAAALLASVVALLLLLRVRAEEDPQPLCTSLKDPAQPADCASK